MVFSDDFLHFLKIKKNLLNSPKLSCGFNIILRTLWDIIHRPIPPNYVVIKIASWQLNFTTKFHFSEIDFGQTKLISAC